MKFTVVTRLFINVSASVSLCLCLSLSVCVAVQVGQVPWVGFSGNPGVYEGSKPVREGGRTRIGGNSNRGASLAKPTAL